MTSRTPATCLRSACLHKRQTRISKEWQADSYWQHHTLFPHRTWLHSSFLHLDAQVECLLGMVANTQISKGRAQKGLACREEGPRSNALCNAELPAPVNIHPCSVAAHSESSPAATAGTMLSVWPMLDTAMSTSRQARIGNCQTCCSPVC